MLELVLGLLSYVYYEQAGSELRRNLPGVFKRSYAVDKERTEAIDQIQQKVKKKMFALPTANQLVEGRRRQTTSR